MGQYMTRSKLLTSALGAAFLGAVAMATPAHALDAKQCLPMAEMNAALKADNQRSLILGNRHGMAVVVNGDARNGVLTPNYMNAVTSNADGSVGYQIEGDQPRDQISTQVCVRAKLTNVQLLDARSTDIPNAVLLGGAFNQGVRELAEKGTRPMLVADTVFGTQKGLPLVVFGNLAHRSGGLITRLPDGTPQTLAVMGQTDYTPEALSRLNRPRVLALAGGSD